MSFPEFSASSPEIQWQRFCDLLWFHDDLKIWLDVSRMQFTFDDFEALQPVLGKAFKSMASLEAGAISNTDEERQVGHYWLRQSSLAPDFKAAELITQQINLVDDFSKKIISAELKPPNNERFTDVLWIGIGGSALGPLLMTRALKNKSGLKFHFLDNIDPNGINNVLDQINSSLKKTLFIIVSKSGGTPEPRVSMEQARLKLEQNGGIWPAQSVAITMKNSRLDNQARNECWLQRFDMPDWVGGRTSITSSVGLLPTALAGCNIRNFLDGAAQMDEATRDINLRQNPAALMAASWFIAGEGKGKRDMVVLPYRDRLEVFSRYLQQLIMESLGKKIDRTGKVVNQGLSVYGNKGSTDQHAYVQQLRDGLDNFFVTFIETLEDSKGSPTINDERPGDFLSGFLQGTRSALTESNRQSLTITLQCIDERRLGALIALFERAVGIYGELIDVNSYHQPGVEAGKLAAAEILKLQVKVENLLDDGVSRSVSNIREILGESNSEPIYWILRHLTANDNNYEVQGSWGYPASIKICKSLN